MSHRITPTIDPTLGAPAPDGPEAGVGCLLTERGNLPLEGLELRARITGLIGHTELVQIFQNPYPEPLEATYVFPLPDRAAVTGMRMTAADRVIQAELAERGQARAQYDEAVAAGRRAAIAEEERPDTFTMRVGNILPGERVSVTLTLAGQLPYEDGEATFRFPLVVAPRYIPGMALTGDRVGDGHAPDTDAVPDASRITPPTLLPGFPYPVRLDIALVLEPGGLPVDQVRCSLPLDADASEGTVDGDQEATLWRVRPGQRADQDLVVRLRYGQPAVSSSALRLCPDPTGDEGTFQLTLLPPAESAAPRPRDVVLVLDRSGSMRGWKLTAARRAAARIVDTLTTADRFAVLTFDNLVERPPSLPAGLVPGTDRHRFQAVAHLAEVTARGGTELLTPLREALGLLAADAAGPDPEAERDFTADRDRVLVLVTDGQVGNEDQLLRESSGALAGIRVHTVGIDRAVNAGFLGRLAAAGGGRCELVESEDRLDEAAERIHRRIGAPLVTGLRYWPAGLDVLPDTVTPGRMPALFPGAPLVLTGRFHGPATGALRLEGTDAAGQPWQTTVPGSTVDNPALAAIWARAHLRDLEDRYVAAQRTATPELERRIVDTSLRFSVLCRFTAYVAVDSRVVTDGTDPHRVIQPVSPPAGWEESAGQMPAGGPAGMAVRAAFAGPAVGGAEAAEFTATPPSPAPPASAGQSRSPAGLNPAISPMRWRRGGMVPGAAVRPGRGRAKERQAAPAALPADLLATEAARLRAAAGAPEPHRRQLLADLASRLVVLLPRHQPQVVGPDGHLAELHRLLDQLSDDRVLGLPTDEFTTLWTRMQTLLDRLAAASTPAGTSGPAAGSSAGAEPERTAGADLPPRRRPFWKRD